VIVSPPSMVVLGVSSDGSAGAAVLEFGATQI
jgi:hypothetical protein